MIEVNKPSHADLFPVGSIWFGVANKYALYDIYENEESNEYVELWVPLREVKSNG